MAQAPIDRGWAWVICAAAFMNSTILIGMFKCFGMFFAEMLEIYHRSASGTSSMLALSGGLSLFIGPLVMTFSDMYTCRMVSMIGGVFCCLGFLVPAYCDSAEQVILTFGILTGLGYGMCLMPGTVIVGRYFVRHRSLANGLLFSGGGVGGIIVPLFLNYIIEAFGFRSALVILAGFALQAVVFASFYRPLAYWSQLVEKDESLKPVIAVVIYADEGEREIDRQQPNESSQQTLGVPVLDRLYSVPEDRCLDDAQSNGGGGTVATTTTASPSFAHYAHRKRSLSFRKSLPVLFGNNEKPPPQPPSSAATRLSATGHRLRKSESINKEIGSNASLYFSTMDIASWWPTPEQQKAVVRVSSVVEPPADHQTSIEKAIEEGDEQQHEQLQEEEEETIIDQPSGAAGSNRWKLLIKRMCYARNAEGRTVPLLDFSLMKDTRFLLFVTSAAFFIPVMYIGMIVPPHCLELGMTKTQVAVLLSIQGGADTIGRLASALLGDRSFIRDRRKVLAAGTFVVNSLSTYAAVLLNTFWGQAAFLIVSSLARGVYVAMMPVVLVDLVGVENFSRALGLHAFVQAFAVTISPLVIGALRDWTLTYNSGFILIASCFAVSACCFLLIVFVDRRRAKE